MAGNVMVIRDQNENIRPDKSKSREKIDGIIAAVMAVDRDMRNRTVQQSKPAYETGGIFVL
jgi:phage terminase large subunit-like protein